MSAAAQNRKSKMSCTGAILAGGASSRMGRSKQDMVLNDGTPMIARVHVAVSAVCDRAVMLGESVHLRELDRIADLRPECGPLGGVEALLASGLDEQYLILPCDVPLITAGVLKALLIETDRAATMFEGHPLPARVSTSALPTVRRMLDAGERTVWRLMEELDAERVALPDESGAFLENVNSPEDVERLNGAR